VTATYISQNRSRKWFFASVRNAHRRVARTSPKVSRRTDAYPVVRTISDVEVSESTFAPYEENLSRLCPFLSSLNVGGKRRTQAGEAAWAVRLTNLLASLARLAYLAPRVLTTNSAPPVVLPYEPPRRRRCRARTTQESLKVKGCPVSRFDRPFHRQTLLALQCDQFCAVARRRGFAKAGPSKTLPSIRVLGQQNVLALGAQPFNKGRQRRPRDVVINCAMKKADRLVWTRHRLHGTSCHSQHRTQVPAEFIFRRWHRCAGIYGDSRRGQRRHAREPIRLPLRVDARVLRQQIE